MKKEITLDFNTYTTELYIEEKKGYERGAKEFLKYLKESSALFSREQDILDVHLKDFLQGEE